MCNEHHVVRHGSLVNDAYIITQPEVPNKELYSTHRMVHLIEEVPEEELFKNVDGRGRGRP